jgi:hypothetical protein
MIYVIVIINPLFNLSVWVESVAPTVCSVLRMKRVTYESYGDERKQRIQYRMIWLCRVMPSAVT